MRQIRWWLENTNKKHKNLRKVNFFGFMHNAYNIIKRAKYNIIKRAT